MKCHGNIHYRAVGEKHPIVQNEEFKGPFQHFKQSLPTEYLATIPVNPLPGSHQDGFQQQSLKKNWQQAGLCQFTTWYTSATYIEELPPVHRLCLG